MKFIYLLVLMVFLSGSCFAADIEFPENSNVTIIGDALYIQGKEVAIWQLKTKQPVAQIAQFYKDKWQKKADKFNLTKINQDVIINRAFNGVLYTAQLTQSYKGCIGIISLSKEPGNKIKRVVQKTQKVSKPSGTKILNKIISKDGAKYSTTMVMENNLSISRNLQYYFNYYQKKGWVINQRYSNKSGNEGHILAKNGPAELNVTFQKKRGKTYLTAVRVDAGI